VQIVVNIHEYDLLTVGYGLERVSFLRKVPRTGQLLRSATGNPFDNQRQLFG
jgi:hypothetical protein